MLTTGGVMAGHLELAISRAHDAFAHAAPSEELNGFFALLRESVEAVLAGSAPPRMLPHSFATERIIERVRMELIDVIHAAGSEGAADAFAVLAALGTVQRGREVAQESDNDEGYLASDRVAMELTTELAHDVRSPLTAILFLVDMLRSGRGGAVSAAQARQLGIIYGAAFGLTQLTTDIIDHVNGARRVEPTPVSFSITDLLHSVRDVLAPMIEERQLEMYIASFPDDGRLGYPALLYRVLLNLASNALKYTPKGSVALRARQLAGTRVEFTVIDTGPGIPRHVQDRLFQPFRRGEHDARRHFSSSGLGLTICRDLVAMMGGELRVDSAPGRGAHFSFDVELPLATSR